MFDMVNGYCDSDFDKCCCFPPKRDCSVCRDRQPITKAHFHSPNDYFAFGIVGAKAEEGIDAGRGNGESDCGGDGDEMEGVEEG